LLTTAITAAIVGALSLFGMTPTPWLIGAIWIGVKVLVVGGIFGLVAKFLQKRKAPVGDA
jgi:hypothetical protein